MPKKEPLQEQAIKTKYIKRLSALKKKKGTISPLKYSRYRILLNYAYNKEILESEKDKLSKLKYLQKKQQLKYKTKLRLNGTTKRHMVRKLSTDIYKTQKNIEKVEAFIERKRGTKAKPNKLKQLFSRKKIDPKTERAFKLLNTLKKNKKKLQNQQKNLLNVGKIKNLLTKQSTIKTQPQSHKSPSFTPQKSSSKSSQINGHR